MDYATKHLQTLATIPLQLLKAFVIAGNSASLEQAAQAMGLTQPALTMQLQKFEELVGAPLFEAQGRRKTLTQIGRKLLIALMPKFEQLDGALRDAFHEIRKGSSIRFRIGMRQEMLEIVCTLLQYSHPLEFVSFASTQLIQELESGSLDAAVVNKVPKNPHFVVKKLLSTKASLWVHRKFLQGESYKDIANADFVRNTPFLAYKDPAPFINEWLKRISLGASDLNTVCVCDNWNALARLIENGEGFSILPSNIRVSAIDALGFSLAESIVPKTQFYLVYRKNLKYVEQFQDVIRKLKSTGVITI